MTTYLLDANVFIQAKNLHYQFEVVPAFWQWIDREHAAGIVFSIEKVGDELLAIGDDLAAWAKARSSLFLKPDAPLVTSLTLISTWANSAGYQPAGVTAFLQSADFYLVAHAHAHGQVVVTHELPGQGSIKKIKIPDACISNAVKCVTPWAMLRTEKARFVL